MRLRLRLLWLFVRSLLRRRLTPAETSTIRLVVLPNDIDVLHVTNDRYLAYMDLGRNDFAVRLGLLAAARRLHAYPSVRFCAVRFRRKMRLFQAFDLRTRLLSWDEESAWFEQEFLVAGRSVAIAYCNVEMRARGANVPPSSILEIAGHREARAPELPEAVATLKVVAQAMRLRQQCDGLPKQSLRE